MSDSFSGPRDPDVSGDTPELSTGTYESGTATVGTTASVICTVPGGYNGGVVVQASSDNTVDVHLGDSAVTDSTGIALAKGTSITLPGGKGVARDLYGVASAADQSVSFLFAAD